MEIKKILITRTDHIGDVLLATPVARALRKKFPDVFISFLTSSYASVVLEGNPDINEILLIENEGITGELKGKKFDVAFILFPEWKVCRAVFLAGIPVRIGPANKWFVPLFLNKPVFQHRSRVEKHEAEYNLDLLKQIAVEEKDSSLVYNISDEAKDFAKKWKLQKEVKENDKFIIIHPGMKGSALNWPMENYARLADKIIRDLKAKVLFTYGTGEGDLIKDLAGLMNEKPIVLDKILDLSLLAGLIKEANLLFCPSTGILHLGVAVGTKVAAIFSPILVQGRKRWGPYGEGHIVFEPEVNCPERFKCRREKCLHYNCMEKISVDRVFTVLKDYLCR